MEKSDHKHIFSLFTYYNFHKLFMQLFLCFFLLFFSIETLEAKHKITKLSPPNINIIFLDDAAILPQDVKVRHNNWDEWETRLPSFIDMLEYIAPFTKDVGENENANATLYAIEISLRVKIKKKEEIITKILQQIHQSTARPSAILARSTMGDDQLRIIFQDSHDYPPAHAAKFLRIFGEISPIIPHRRIAENFGPFQAPPTIIFDPRINTFCAGQANEQLAKKRWGVLEDTYLLPHYVLHNLAVLDKEITKRGDTFYVDSIPELGTIESAKILIDIPGVSWTGKNREGDWSNLINNLNVETIYIKHKGSKLSLNKWNTSAYKHVITLPNDHHETLEKQLFPIMKNAINEDKNIHIIIDKNITFTRHITVGKPGEDKWAAGVADYILENVPNNYFRMQAMHSNGTIVPSYMKNTDKLDYAIIASPRGEKGLDLARKRPNMPIDIITGLSDALSLRLPGSKGRLLKENQNLRIIELQNLGTPVATHGKLHNVLYTGKWKILEGDKKDFFHGALGQILSPNIHYSGAGYKGADKLMQDALKHSHEINKQRNPGAYGFPGKPEQFFSNSPETGGILFEKGNIYTLDLTGKVRRLGDKAVTALDSSDGISGTFEDEGEIYRAVGIPMGSKKHSKVLLGNILMLQHDTFDKEDDLPFAVPRFLVFNRFKNEVFGKTWTFEPITIRGVSILKQEPMLESIQVNVIPEETGNRLSYLIKEFSMNNDKSVDQIAAAFIAYKEEGSDFWPALMVNTEKNITWIMRHGLQIKFDSFGHIQSIVGPAGERVNYLHDRIKLIGQQASSGQQIKIRYKDNKPVEINTSKSVRVMYGYQAGLLSQVINQEFKINFSYKNTGKISLIAKGNNNIHFGYDSKGRVNHFQCNESELTIEYIDGAHTLRLLKNGKDSLDWRFRPNKGLSGIVSKEKGILWTKSSEGRIIQLTVAKLEKTKNGYNVYPELIIGTQPAK